MPFELSHLDTSFGALIRSGAALLGIVLGGFVLAAKPRTRFTKLFGLALVLDGIGYSAFTLAGGYDDGPGDVGFPHKELVVPAHLVFFPIGLAVAGLLMAAFWPEVLRFPKHARRFAPALVAAAPAVLLTPIALVVFGPVPVEDYGSRLGAALAMADAVGYGLYIATLTIVGAAVLAQVRRDPSGPRARALLLVAAYAISNVVIKVGDYLADSIREPFPPWAVVTLLVASAAIVQLPLAFLGLRSLGGGSRWVAVVLMLACLATAPVQASVELYAVRDIGFGGIVSLVFLLGVGYAIFRLGLLGVQVPRPRAGFYAALGLASLFATAQVAQNFLSDGLGLLWGGVVAGIVVFAAGPLQRRMERTAQAPREDLAAKYRRLVETAWTDGQLGANERLLLAESRRQLGLDAETASRIDEDVARALARAPRRPVAGKA